jgi:AraC family transcriptional regulator, transcriptional activator of pobA
VGCVGFLFYGSSGNLFLNLDDKEEKKIRLLLEVFKDEFDNTDQIQEEMLRILLVRLIISITRIAKLQYLPDGEIDGQKFDLVRKFNLLVENHYKTRHDVKFYAEQLHKSPKTLSNAFALYGNKSPLQVIHDRIILEAKRLLNYTDKSAKEVSSDLGFDDAAHFSKFFKNQIEMSPTDFKKSLIVKPREK